MSYLHIDSFFLGHLNNAENGKFHSKSLFALEPEGLVAAISVEDKELMYLFNTVTFTKRLWLLSL